MTVKQLVVNLLMFKIEMLLQQSIKNYWSNNLISSTSRKSLRLFKMRLAKLNLIHQRNIKTMYYQQLNLRVATRPDSITSTPKTNRIDLLKISWIVIKRLRSQIWLKKKNIQVKSMKILEEVRNLKYKCSIKFKPTNTHQAIRTDSHRKIKAYNSW